MAEGQVRGVVPTADPFVGRGPAASSLHRAISESVNGHGSLVLVAGEAGIGKTRLVEEVAARARDDGHLMVWGSCWDGDGVPAFWPWSEALQPVVALHDVADELVTLLWPHQGAATSQVAPLDETRFRAFNLVSDLLRDLSERQPMVVVLDDLHWADPGTLELLRVVARRARGQRVAVIGTFRDTDVGPEHHLHVLLGDLARHGERVVLDGLATSEVGELLAASGTRLDEDALVRVTARTGGNPFFVREVARAVGAGDEVPPAVRDVVLRRTELLVVSTRQVLEAAAILGRVDTPVLARMVGADGLAVDEAIHDLVAQRLVVSEGEGPRFAHALVRETVVECLSPRRRADLHASAASAIEAVSGPVAVDALAFHHIRAAGTDAEAAVGWVAAAGREAMRRLAYEQAASWFQQAVALASSGGTGGMRTRAELLIELAEALRRTAGGSAAGQAASSEAAALARDLGDAELLASAAIAHSDQLSIGTLSFRVGDPASASLVDEALAALPPADSVLRARLLARAASNLSFTTDPTSSPAVARDALAVARRVGDPIALIEALSVVPAFWVLHDDDPALHWLDELEALSAATGSREALLTAIVNRITAARLRGDRPDLERRVAQLGRVLDELHLPVHDTYRHLFQAVILRLDGELAEAERVLLTALAGLEGDVHGFVTTLTLNQLLIVFGEQDRFSEVLDEARRSFTTEERADLLISRAALTYIEATSGDRLAAAAELERLTALWREAPVDVNWAVGLVLLCRAATSLDDHASAAALYEAGEPYAGHEALTGFGTITFGLVGTALAELAILLGRFDDAVRLLEASESHYGRLRATAHLVECRYLRARLAGARGDPRAASLAESVAREADALGMARVARLARQVVEGTPEPPAEEGQTGVSCSTFRRDGNVWTVGFGGREVRLLDTKGMADIAALLRRAGSEVHVAELVGVGDALGPAPSKQELLDDSAIGAYRARLAELTEAEDEADLRGDVERSARARAEREALIDRLAADLGVGGQARSAPDWVERARKAVRRRVDAALKRIEAEHPAAGRHLRHSIRTGAFCSYDPAEPVKWDTS